VFCFDGESGTRWCYDTEARLGDDSGFGQVFRGTGADGQVIAVKRVPLRWDRESERRRREREVEIFRILATTASEHVMVLLDVGRVGDDLLLVMALADRSLAAAIPAGDFTVADRIEALRQVARGLVELAQVPVLHRDLKPANVLYVGDRWQLADFGISRNLLESTDTYTFRGFGTLPYMAPELWNGQPATVKTDVYAFGVLAYEVLTGSRPFTGADEAALMRQHQQEAPPPLPANVPAGLARLVLRLLAKDPAQRPQDARAVLESLNSAARRLGRQQESLRAAALDVEKARSTREASDASWLAELTTHEQRVHQALADLQHMVEEAADEAREALPEVKLSASLIGSEWQLAWEEVRLLIQAPTSVFRPTRYSSGSRTLAGVVHTAAAIDSNRKSQELAERDQREGSVFAQFMPTPIPPLANIVCELEEDRLPWSLLRFVAHTPAGIDRYGPRSSPHGLDLNVFEREWPYIIDPERRKLRRQRWNARNVPVDQPSDDKVVPRAAEFILPTTLPSQEVDRPWGLQRVRLTSARVLELLRQAISESASSIQPVLHSEILR
jgi:serine/threonine protein kinase